MIIFVNNLAQIAWLISLFKKLGIDKNYLHNCLFKFLTIVPIKI